jgi:hypothetical protein
MKEEHSEVRGFFGRNFSTVFRDTKWHTFPTDKLAVGAIFPSEEM